MGKMTTASDVMKNVSNGTSVGDVVKNLTDNDTSYEGYVQAVSNLTSVTADLSNKLPKTAAGVNIVADLNKIYTDIQNDNIKVSNIVSLAADLSSTAASLSALPQLKFALYALSAGLTALSWGISEFEDASEAGERERERLEKLFDDCKAEVDNIWSDEAWKDEYGIFLLYKVQSASAVENSGNMRFKIIFNKELEEDLTMSYYTAGNKDGATQDKDYKGVSDKNPAIFTVPKGVKEWYIDVPIIDDSEKEDNEEFGIVVNHQNSIKHPFIYGYGEAIGTIIDDESPAIITISDATANEADTEINFEITLNRALDEDITLNVEPFMLDSANSNVKNTASYDDFSDIPTSITIKAGETSATYTMQIKDDKFPENTESFGLWFIPSQDDINKYGFAKEYIVNGKIIDDDESIVSVKFLDNHSNEGNNDKESKECEVIVSGLENLASNQRVEVFANTNDTEQPQKLLTFYANSNSTGEYTFYWEGDEDPNGDRTYSLSGSAYIVTTDEEGYESIEYARVNNGLLKIKDDDKDPNDDLPETYDPLVIDLNGDGVKGTSLDYSINFDLNSDGFKEATSWIDSNDAFIAIDKNANGIIDNGSELFGDKSVSNTTYAYTNPTSKNGFESLKAFDSNNDNIIDIKDDEFANLLLWQDKNSNGISEADEITKLSEVVKSINLNYTNSGGSEISTATLNNGNSVSVSDMYFKVDLKKTDEIINSDEIPLEIKSLPNITATGNLHSLHSAMSKNETLATMLNLYLLMDSDTRKANINSLIYEWAGVSDIEPNARTTSMDTRQLAVYEKLQGKPFTWHGTFDDNNVRVSATILENRYQSFANFVYASLELQTTYSYLNLDFEILKFDENLGKYSYDFNSLNSQIQTLYQNDKLDEIRTLSNIIRTSLTYKPFANSLLKENYANNFKDSKELLSLLYGTHITGTNNNEALNGTDESDYINGLGGNDTLRGGNGNDVYEFTGQFGNDTIYDTAGDDSIYLDINSDRISLKRELANLIIQTKDENGELTGNKITIQNYFNINPELGNGVIENIKFADGNNKFTNLNLLVA